MAVKRSRGTLEFGAGQTGGDALRTGKKKGTEFFALKNRLRPRGRGSAG